MRIEIYSGFARFALLLHASCLQSVPEKNAQSLPFTHHNFATVHHGVMWFSANCSERNHLHVKGQCLNTAIKYSLFCIWEVNHLKTKLTAKSLKQIHGINKVRAAKPAFQNY